MKLFKKIAALFTLAMVIGLAAPGTLAKAADPVPLTVSIGYVEQVVTVEVKDSNDDSDYVLYTDKYDADKDKAGKVIWEKADIDPDTKKAIIDISWTKATADVSLWFKTAKSAVATVEVKAMEAYFIAGFSGTNEAPLKSGTVPIPKYSGINIASEDFGYLYFATGKSPVILPEGKAGTVEWRKGTTGNWNDDLGELELSDYAAKGATLYFRIKADDTVGNRVSKEAKVGYAKQAAAPKVAVDGSKWTIALKKGLEYKIAASGSKWVNAEKAHSFPVLLADLGTEAGADGKIAADKKSGFNGTAPITVLVRAVGTSKKIPSKIAEVVVGQPNDVDTVLKLDDTDATKHLYTDSYTAAYDDKSGLTFTNKSDKVLQVLVIASADIPKFDLTAKTTKWVTVPAKKGEKNGTVKIAYKSISPLTDPKILLRVASIKAVAAKGTTPAVDFMIASPYVTRPLPTKLVQTFAVKAGETLTAQAKDKETVTGKFTMESTNITADTAPKIAKKSGDGVTLKGPSKVLKGGTPAITEPATPAKPIESEFTFTVAKGAKAGTSTFEITVEGVTTTVTITVTAAPVLTKLTVAAAEGTATGKTKITVTGGGSGTTFSYKLGGAADSEPVVGSAAPSGTALTSGSEITATADQYISVYEIKDSKVVGFGSVKIVAANIKA